MLTEICFLLLVILFNGKGADASCCRYSAAACLHTRGNCDKDPEFRRRCPGRHDYECQFLEDGRIYTIFDYYGCNSAKCYDVDPDTRRLTCFPQATKPPWTGSCCANDLEGCNIFCCRCNRCHYPGTVWPGPGRKSLDNLFNATYKQPAYENPAQQIMKAVDSNKDGVIDLIEAADYAKIEVKSREVVPDWFKKMDLSGDGFIQPLELDQDYYDGSVQPESLDSIRVHANVQYLP